MANHYVSPSGSATWAASTNIDTPTSIATANANAVAGDTVYFRGGTYYYYLRPANSGTDISNRVIFQAYPGETPTWTVDDAGGRWAILLQGRSWIKVDGLRIYNSAMFFRIGYGSCYNEFVNCTFDTCEYHDYSSGLITWTSTAGVQGGESSHNWIHNCVFTKYGYVSSCQDAGTIRLSSNYNDPSRNNTVEDCVFSYGGHDCLDIGGRYNVVRNNVFHNEEAYFVSGGACPNAPASGYFGNRCVLLSNSGNNVGTAQHTLVEGNRIGHAGTPPDDDGAFGIENAGFHSIIRFNDLYNNGGAGYYGKQQSIATYPNPLGSQNYTRFYNNSLYHNGWGGADISGTQFHYGIIVWSYTTYNDWPLDVVLKNNIVEDSVNLGDGELEWRVGTSNILPQITYENNWGVASGDPLFVSTSIADPLSLTLPNLELQAGSGCIRAGSHLTLTNGAGTNSTTLAVDDSRYFQDGSWGSILSDIRPDWIAIGSVTNVVEIESIDFDLNVITLATPTTWADNDPVWLYIKSDGVRVLYGSAPDIGAHPYAEGAATDTSLVPAAAAVALASSVPTLSPGADDTLVVDGADVAAECESPLLGAEDLSPWAIRLGPEGAESTLPPPNWRAGDRPKLRIERRTHITRVELDDGSVRHHYRTSAPRSWTFTWTRLSASDVLGIRNLTGLNEPLHFQNRIESADWTWVIIEEFDPIPIAASFASGTPRYRATLVLREAL